MIRSSRVQRDEQRCRQRSPRFAFPMRDWRCRGAIPKGDEQKQQAMNMPDAVLPQSIDSARTRSDRLTSNRIRHRTARIYRCNQHARIRRQALHRGQRLAEEPAHVNADRDPQEQE